MCWRGICVYVYADICRHKSIYPRLSACCCGGSHSWLARPRTRYAHFSPGCWHKNFTAVFIAVFLLSCFLFSFHFFCFFLAILSLSMRTSLRWHTKCQYLHDKGPNSVWGWGSCKGSLFGSSKILEIQINRLANSRQYTVQKI